ncbi:hypothetical protein IFM89_005639, partial [Coptis chinensis]
MKTILIRTGSAPVQSSLIHKVVHKDLDSVTGTLFSGKDHLEFKDMMKKKDRYMSRSSSSCKSIRRTRSETDVIRSVSCRAFRSRSRSFPARILEEEEKEEGDISNEGQGKAAALLMEKDAVNVLDTYNGLSGICLGANVVEEEEEKEDIAFLGGGTGKGRNVGGGNGGDGFHWGGLSGGNADQSKIGAYYQELLKADPGNALLLRNYGKFLHEVEGDAEKAEEYYARAILASPGDGEVLSLYGTLIWETYKDGERAQTYFDQAAQASPDDCYVMGSYANFLWDAEDDEEEEEGETREVI